MASLLCDVHFWTANETVGPKDTDHGTFKYYDKSQHKGCLERPYGQDKLTFSRSRGQVTLLEGKRLKSAMKELEELMLEQSIVFSSWRSSTFIQMMFASGLIANIYLSKLGDITKVTFDKYLVGKLLDYISDVAFTSKVIIVTYLESRVSIITFTRSLNFQADDANLAQAEPKVQLLDLLGPPGRRMNRRISLSSDSSTCLFWWSISGQEVYPWTPNLNEEDRANMILYNLKSKKGVKKLGYARTHSDPVLIRYISDRTILLMGQDASRPGEVLIDSALYTHFEGEKQLRRSRANRLTLTSSIKCCVSVNDYLAIVSTADGTLLLIDISQNKLECQTKGAFIPNVLTLHPEKALILSANEKGLLQCWDIALNPITLSLSSEADFGSSTVLDIGHNLQRLPIGLSSMTWCDKSKFPPTMMETMAFNYLLIRFQTGPLALVRFSGGVLASSGSFGVIPMINQHLRFKNFHAALLLMNQMDWPSQGESILIGINKTFHKLYRQPELTKENETMMEMCLGLFYAPNRPIPEGTIDEFSEQVHDIARKFFHRLLRHDQVQKAFQLAVDINDYDLFMDIHHYATRKDMSDLADAALIKAQAIFANANVTISPSESSDDEHETDIAKELHVSSLPRPYDKANFSFFNAAATPAIAVLEQPDQQGQPASIESSILALQPQLNAVYQRTTAAKRISTKIYQTKAEVSHSPSPPPPAPQSLGFASLPKGVPEQAVQQENPDDIKVIHFGVV